MTWAERVGDLGTRIVLVILAAIRVVTELLRLIAVTLDRFVTDLGEHSEAGLRRVETHERAWVRLPGVVLLGLALALLQLLAIFTVLIRQATTKLNDLIVGLAEGEDHITGASSA
ncbi:MAG: hypothetical protein Kow0047_17740 [Anaerolineae bacterium]